LHLGIRTGTDQSSSFEDYLERLKTLTDEQFAYEAFMQAFDEKFDLWNV
jgi:hypothetical protein